MRGRAERRLHDLHASERDADVERVHLQVHPVSTRKVHADHKLLHQYPGVGRQRGSRCGDDGCVGGAIETAAGNAELQRARYSHADHDGELEEAYRRGHRRGPRAGRTGYRDGPYDKGCADCHCRSAQLSGVHPFRRGESAGGRRRCTISFVAGYTHVRRAGLSKSRAGLFRPGCAAWNASRHCRGALPEGPRHRHRSDVSTEAIVALGPRPRVRPAGGLHCPPRTAARECS